MFSLFKKAFKAAKAISEEFDVLKNRSLDEIFLIEDMDNLLVAMNIYVDNKCDCGENLAVLSQEEKVFWICKYLESEVLNGGIEQFFSNSGLDFVNDVSPALTQIGASTLAEAFNTVIAAFDGKVPTNEKKFDELLGKNYSRFEKVFEAFDEAFCEYEDTFPKLCYEYLMKNKENFN